LRRKKASQIWEVFFHQNKIASKFENNAAVPNLEQPNLERQPKLVANLVATLANLKFAIQFSSITPYFVNQLGNESPDLLPICFPFLKPIGILSA